MKRWSILGLVFVLLLAFVLPAASAEAAGPRTYTVRVGWEDARRGTELNAYFPGTVHIHVGDTVRWQQQTHEIHTVTFLHGNPAPEIVVPAPQELAGTSPLMFNPDAVTPNVPAGGQYDGSAPANSGLMGLDPGQVRTFSLTFTQGGTYDYICLVHGMMMSGHVIVEAAGQSVASPEQAAAQGQRERARLLAQVPGVTRAAQAATKRPTHNPDGTTTYHVMLGYTSGQIDLMRFFPSSLTVKRGDQVTWEYSKSDAPHTVTFFNGTPDPSLVIPTPFNGGTVLLINPAVLFPSQAGQPLTRQGFFNSGLMSPPGGPPPNSFTITIGQITGLIRYVCLLHDESGMVGSLVVRAGR